MEERVEEKKDGELDNSQTTSDNPQIEEQNKQEFKSANPQFDEPNDFKSPINNQENQPSKSAFNESNNSDNQEFKPMNSQLTLANKSQSIASIISKGIKNTSSAIYSTLNSLKFKKKVTLKDYSAKLNDVEKEKIAFIPEKRNNSENMTRRITPKKEGFLSTNIPGFDSLLSKGIPRGISVLLMGGPGCGKTTFGLHLLSEAAKRGEKCLYMSFEEKESQLENHMKNYGFPVKELISSGNLVIKRYDPFIISQSVEALLAEARGELLIKIDKVNQFIPKNFNPDIIVLDSLSAVGAAFAGRKDGYRIYIEQLFRSLEDTGATTFLIAENSASLKKSESGVEEFLADGIISFYNLRIKNTRVKAMEILKLRGVNFKKKIVPFEITEGTGFEVYPMEEIFRKN